MKTISKTAIVLTFITLGITNVAKGQIYESEACFYSQAGSSSVSRIVRFEGSRKLVWVKTYFNRDKLAESKYYYENESWTDGKDQVQMYEYDYSMSTSQRVVYKRVEKRKIHDWQCAYCQYSTNFSCLNCPSIGIGCGRHGYEDGDKYYVAFSKDKSSFIYWREAKSDIDKTPRDKTTYTRVPKKDLLPKAANYDFLNE
ncbi:MAG: hypothetical protein IJ760_05110 [Bacteroidales bacterium]|nr:hypothetical protein [Bacteroidales bacterium]